MALQALIGSDVGGVVDSERGVISRSEGDFTAEWVWRSETERSMSSLGPVNGIDRQGLSTGCSIPSDLGSPIPLAVTCPQGPKEGRSTVAIVKEQLEKDRTRYAFLHVMSR
jgi:hypothetical protein